MGTFSSLVAWISELFGRVRAAAGGRREEPDAERMEAEEGADEDGARQPKSDSTWRKAKAELSRRSRQRYHPSSVTVRGRRYEIDWMTARRQPQVYRLTNKKGTRRKVVGGEAHTAIKAATRR